MSSEEMADAKVEFERPEIFNHHAVPVIVEKLSVKKDKSVAGISSMEMAPNFASAVLGSWIATRLGLGGPEPEGLAAGAAAVEAAVDDEEDDGCVVSGATAVMLPGEGTLLLGPSSSGKTTLLTSLCQLVGGYADEKSVICDGVLVGNVDPMKSEKNLKRTTGTCCAPRVAVIHVVMRK